MNKANYRPEIDGLRAIAILPVIFFHAHIPLFSNGFMGVDIFFVISGYLISSIIFKQLEGGNFSFLNFYQRRVYRILPALLIMIFCVLLASLLLLNPNEIKQLTLTVFSSIFFYSNYYFYGTLNYFSAQTEFFPLIHTWSLSIEEQFYLVFPFLSFLLFRKNLILFFKFILIFFMIYSFVSMIKISITSIEGNYFYSTMIRSWELLLGVSAAIIHHKIKQNKLTTVLSFFGFILILVGFCLKSNNYLYPNLYTLFPTIGTFFIILFSKPDTLTTKILSYQIIVLIGLISYSLYLWHQPIFALYRNFNLTPLAPLDIFILIVSIFLISFISYKFIEKPFRQKKINHSGKILLVMIMLNLMIAVLILMNNGEIRKYSSNEKDMIELIDKHKSINEEKYVEKHMRCYDLYTKDISAESILTNNKNNGCETITNNNFPTIVLIGDSHAAYLGHHSFERYLKNEKLNYIQFTFSRCAPLVKNKSDICNKINNYVKNKLEEIKPDIIFNFNTFRIKEYAQNESQFIEEHIEELSKLRNHTKKVYLIGQIPTYHPSLPKKLLSMQSKNYKKFISIDEVEKSALQANKETESEIRKYKQIEFVSLIDLFCKNNLCQIASDNNLKESIYIFDYGHLTDKGAKHIYKQKIYPLIKDIKEIN